MSKHYYVPLADIRDLRKTRSRWAHRSEPRGSRATSTNRSGDLLFVDSTHTVRIGGDVVRIFLGIIPRLPPGVIIHIHDIYLPYDFQRDADSTLFQAMETALLHALLIGNTKLEILFCLSQLHYDRADMASDAPDPD